jgi:hypothetical protein
MYLAVFKFNIIQLNSSDNANPAAPWVADAARLPAELSRHLTILYFLISKCKEKQNNEGLKPSALAVAPWRNAALEAKNATV